MNRIAMFYSRRYAAPDCALLARLDVGAQRLLRHGLVEAHEPASLDLRDLRGLHSDAYLDAFEHGQEPLASSQGIAWSAAVRDATYAMLAGQIAAAKHALAHRVALNFARGFHHAVRERGVGFCALNGLALLPKLRPDLRVFVIDCDEHGGNGTEEYAAELPNLYHASIFGTRFGCRGGLRSWAFPIAGGSWIEYRRALRQVQHLVRSVRPDLLVYQAGADCHLDDPKSRARIDERAMYRRDLLVFGTAVDLKIPTLFLVAGGYQSPEIVARLNENTVRAARVAFHGVADAGPAHVASATSSHLSAARERSAAPMPSRRDPSASCEM